MSLHAYLEMPCPQTLEYPKFDTAIEDHNERFKDFQRRLYKFKRQTEPTACRRKDYLKKLNTGKIRNYQESTIKKYDLKHDESTKKWY